MGALGDAYHHLSQIAEGERTRKEVARYEAFIKEKPPLGAWNTCPYCKAGVLNMVCTSQVRTIYSVGDDGKLDLTGPPRGEPYKPVNPSPDHLECANCGRHLAFDEFQHLDTRNERDYGDLIGRYVRPRR